MAMTIGTMPLAGVTMARGAVAGAAQQAVASNPQDQFVSSQPATGIVNFKTMLALKAGSNAGKDGINDANVAPARANAAAHEGDKVDWKNPSKTLNNLTQIDSDQGAMNGGSDAVRCGAANLVAGAVLLGPEQTAKAMKAVEQRAAKLMDKYRALAQELPPGSADQKIIIDTMSRLHDGMEKMHDLRDKSTSSLTVKDLQKMQEGVYEVALADQNMTRNGEYNGNGGDPYLYAGPMQTYRDLMWGGHKPQMNGKQVDMFWVDNGRSGGHFVLADSNTKGGSRDVAYNPWPDADGTAFARGVDGKGATLVGRNGTAVPGSVLVGQNIGDEGARLPAR